MGWDGTLNRYSKIGDSIKLTPDTEQEGRYTVTAFIAPRNGVYQFLLKGSGGTNGSLDAANDGANGENAVSGGTGGITTGYLVLDKGETIYCGCGGTCSAAFVSRTNASKLSAVGMGSLYFIAGGGGAGGRSYKNRDEGTATAGGDGGGTAGGTSLEGGAGGTQIGGVAASGAGNAGAYGKGGDGAYAYVEDADVYAWGGRGGDGYYGGAGGDAAAALDADTGNTGSYAYGGGGGSGYVYQKTLKHNEKTYASITSEGGGAEGGVNGSVEVMYFDEYGGLPIVFEGTQLSKVVFNGTEVTGFVYNGQTVF